MCVDVIWYLTVTLQTIRYNHSLAMGGGVWSTMAAEDSRWAAAVCRQMTSPTCSWSGVRSRDLQRHPSMLNVCAFPFTCKALRIHYSSHMRTGVVFFLHLFICAGAALAHTSTSARVSPNFKTRDVHCRADSQSTGPRWEKWVTPQSKVGVWTDLLTASEENAAATQDILEVWNGADRCGAAGKN